MPITPDTPLYNSRIIELFLKLLADKYPHIDAAEVMEHAGMKKREVADPGHWFSQKQIDLFSEKLVQLAADPGIAREAGRYSASPAAFGTLRAFVLGLVGPEYFFHVVNMVAGKLTRSSRMSTRKVGPRQLEVEVAFEEGVREHPFQCDNRIGFFEAVFLFFDHDFPTIEHTECIFKGGTVCRYLISWRPTLASRLILARRFSFLLLPVSFLLLFFGDGAAFAPGLSAVLSLYLGLTLVVHGQERKALMTSLTNMRNSSEKLLAQAQDNCDNALMINDIGKVLSTSTDLEEILANVNLVLSKRLRYARGIILLMDPDRNILKIRGSFGFSAEQRHSLGEMALPVSGPGSSGVLVHCFLSREPLLVNDIAEVKDGAIAENYQLFVGLGVKSFICAPIVCEGDALGVFAVDDPKREGELVQSDLNLIQGVAPVIGIAIKSALRLANERQLSDELRRAGEQLERRVDERTAELSQANQELEFLYDSVSHDLRTPLRVVYGYGELLQELYGDKLDQTGREYLANIISGGERIEATLDRMLDLSEIRLAQIDLRPVNLSRMAEVILADLRIVDPKRVIVVEIQPGVVATGDEKLLTSVMENLLGNAWKYSSGKAESRISFGMRDGIFFVADNGDGFDMAQAEKLFQPFQRLHHDSEFAGHGFGLSMVRKIVERMGGTVWGEGKPGEGATFYFTLGCGEKSPGGDDIGHASACTRISAETTAQAGGEAATPA